MTGREFAQKYNSNQIDEIARDIAGSIVIREYIGGNSYDTRRESTPEEKSIIKNIARAAMVSYGYCSGENTSGTILNTAEFMLHQFLPNANGYDTIYIPLRKVTETW